MNGIFNEILHISVEASFLIIAVLIARLFLKRSSKYFRKVLWGLVGLRLAFPFSVESVFSLVPQRISSAATETVEMAALSASQTQTEELSFLMALPFIWFGIALAFGVYGFVSYIRLKLKISDAVKLEDNVFLSEKVDSPFVCGFIKPRIYVAYGIEEGVLDHILKHERTHIKNADHILKAVGFALVCVHWFNPLVWVSYFLFCKDIELACDESVLSGFSEAQRKKYAKAILDIGVNKVKLSACPVAFGEVGVKERVKNALAYKKAKKLFIAASVGICIVVALCFMTEPKAQEPEKQKEGIIVEETTTEPATEAVTEPSTEITTEPLTERYIEENTQNDVEKSNSPTNSVGYKEEILTVNYDIIVPYYWSTTRHYVTDPMRDQIVEEGLFMDDDLKEKYIKNEFINETEG